jgi:hypothetical protein
VSNFHAIKKKLIYKDWGFIPSLISLSNLPHFSLSKFELGKFRIIANREGPNFGLIHRGKIYFRRVR